MHYQISRDGQMYGPYTLEDIQRYVASGNVLPTDMAKSEEMTEWVPVSQLLAGQTSAPAAFSSPGFADPGFVGPGFVGPGQPAYAPAVNTSGALAASPYPDAPNLHWGLYLLFAVLTCGYFSMVFTCVQAAWLKRVQPNSQAIIFYAGTYILWLLNKARSWHNSGQILAMLQHHAYTPDVIHGAIPLGLLYLALLIATRFVMRNSMQEHFNTVEPIGLNLNPVLTFFFGGVYFQAEINRINGMKQAARLGMGRGF